MSLDDSKHTLALFTLLRSTISFSLAILTAFLRLFFFLVFSLLNFILLLFSNCLDVQPLQALI